MLISEFHGFSFVRRDIGQTRSERIVPSGRFVFRSGLAPIDFAATLPTRSGFSPFPYCFETFSHYYRNDGRRRKSFLKRATGYRVEGRPVGPMNGCWLGGFRVRRTQTVVERRSREWRPKRTSRRSGVHHRDLGDVSNPRRTPRGEQILRLKAGFICILICKICKRKRTLKSKYAREK